MKEFHALFERKQKTKTIKAPVNQVACDFLSSALDILFPSMGRKKFHSVEDFEMEINNHFLSLESILKTLDLNEVSVDKILKQYKLALPKLSDSILKDMEAILAGDPAATGLGEIELSYPGPYAIATYRLAHFFYEQKIPIFPRILTEISHTRTGIDIHPGAKIGESFFIDHGTGIVIGETTIIGNRVKIYQGVTLGALSVDKSLQNKKRHPSIEDECVIYAHATILGGETVIGKGSIIGGNVWLTKSIPPMSVVYHKSEIKLDQKTGFSNIEELSYEI